MLIFALLQATGVLCQPVAAMQAFWSGVFEVKKASKPYVESASSS